MVVLRTLSRQALGLQDRWGIAARRLRTRRLLYYRAIGEWTAEMGTRSRTALYHLVGQEEPIDAVKLRRDLIEFYDRFERLIDVICAGARYGAQPSLAGDYHMLSEDLRGRYGTLRPYLLAYLPVAVIDTQFGISLCGKPTDAFQCLFSAPSLAELIEADDGEVVGRIERTRDALYRFGDHLRAVAD